MLTVDYIRSPAVRDGIVLRKCSQSIPHLSQPKSELDCLSLGSLVSKHPQRTNMIIIMPCSRLTNDVILSILVATFFCLTLWTSFTRESPYHSRARMQRQMLDTPRRASPNHQRRIRMIDRIRTMK